MSHRRRGVVTKASGADEITQGEERRAWESRTCNSCRKEDVTITEEEEEQDSVMSLHLRECSWKEGVVKTVSFAEKIKD